MNMLEEIKTLLVKSVDSEALIHEAASRFFETVEANKKKFRTLEQRLTTCETLKEYWESEADIEEAELLLDMADDVEYQLAEAFDRVEDDVKHELLRGKWAKRVLEDVKAKGIVLSERLGRGRLEEDEVEEIYVEAFRQFDFLRLRLTEHIQQQNPQAFYEHGKAQLDAYRKENGLLMDEVDFNRYFEEHFDKERLYDLFAHKIYETISYNLHYILEEPDESEEEELPSYEEGQLLPYEASQKDAVLVADGDLKADMFSFVYELLGEYTGRRVLESENEHGEEAYWTLYADDFAELLGLFMIAHLENTIRYFADNRPNEYDTLAHMYHWSEDDRRNPEVVLSTCDKISYFLTDMQETLWNEFSEAAFMPLYKRGEAQAKRRRSVGTAPEEKHHANGKQ